MYSRPLESELRVQMMEEELDALKMYSYMDLLNYHVTLWDKNAVLIKKSSELERHMINMHEDQLNIPGMPSDFDMRMPYFVAWIEHNMPVGKVFLTKIEAEQKLDEISELPQFIMPRAMYDNTGMRVRAEPVIAEQFFQRFDELAKSELAPFMFDMKLLNLVGNMNEETLMTAYNEFSL